MKQRIITGLIFALVIGGLVILGFRFPVAALGMMLAAGWLSANELARAFQFKGLRPGRKMMYFSLLLAIVVPLLNSGFAATLATVLFALMLLMITACLWQLLFNGPENLPSAALTAVLLAYLVFPVSMAAVLLFKMENGWMWFVIGLAAPWASDVFAFFTGSLVGRHPIVPSVSPKKTVEGFAGGLVGGMLIIWLALLVLEPVFFLAPAKSTFYLVFIMAGGIFLSIASQFGDWLASGIKRWCGIKDFGSLLPGHGGVLDRFDSAYFTLPAVVLLALVYNNYII